MYQYDRPNNDEWIREQLLGSGAYLAAFTARPSAPPREIEAPPLGYAPEAEIALELVGLPDIPLISFGRLQYLGEERGYDPEILFKPSPVQALAGISAALTCDEWSALQAACDWYETGKRGIRAGGRAALQRLEGITGSHWLIANRKNAR